MSQEWLKKLAELSNDKELVKRAQQMHARAAQAPKPRPAAGGSQRGLFGAAFGAFFRFLLLFAAIQAAAMIVVAGLEGLENEPWGLIYHHVVWYPLTQPILPEPVVGILWEWFGVTPTDLLTFYERINDFIQKYQDALVFLTPIAAALAATLFFLPSINAGRRRTPIRLAVYLANIAVFALIGEFGPGVLVIWLAAFVFSFVGGAGRRPKAVRATAPAEPVRASRPAPATRAMTQVRPTPAPVAQQRQARDSRPAVREPAVSRRVGGGGSWVRAR